MTASPSPAEMAATAFKNGKAAVMYATAMEMLEQHTHSKAAPPALQLANRLHARGSVGRALDILGRVGFTVCGIGSGPLTPAILQDMIKVFNRGAQKNHPRTLSAAGMFILSGGHAQFPKLVEPVTQTLIQKATLFLEQGNYLQAQHLAATAKAANGAGKVPGINALLREIAIKAYDAGDYPSSARAASYMVDPSSPREARADAVTLMLRATRESKPELKYSKGARPQSTLCWSVIELITALDLMRDLPDLKLQTAQTMLELQKRACDHGHFAAVRQIGTQIEETVGLIVDGQSVMRLPALPRKMHPQAHEIAQQSAKIVHQLGRRGRRQPRNGQTTGGAVMA